MFPLSACGPSLTVAVRGLCEFAARRGDLDSRFTPSPTSLEGIAGHQVVAARRGAGYEAELPLEGCHGALRVRGRADGFDPARGRLEEVKTYRGRLERQPANQRALHWAQARVYAALLCEARGLAAVEVALVYFDIDTEAETIFTESCTAPALRQHFEALCEAYLGWAQQEARHRAARDAAWAALAFPHAAFRTGQRPLAAAVYQAARAGRCLLAQAPTGIGKTVGTVFPMLKVATGQGLDRVFFLTAKTSGRALALQALALFRSCQPDLPLRVLELVAREKACEHPGQACHGEACRLARGFYDRLPAAREAALALPAWDKPTLREHALQHQVCPYYLGQELARWADVVVGDYHHFFDASALLHALAQQQGWRVGLLLDEAHNLVERARRMYSAQLDPVDLQAARHRAPIALKKPLDRLHRVWKKLGAAPAGAAAAYQVLPALPEPLLDALRQAATAILDHLAERPAEVDTALQQLAFDALHFTRLAESFGDHSLCDLSCDTPGEVGPRRAAPACRISLRNVVPAPFLKPRWAAAHTATLFSATLQPSHYHLQMLGLPEDTAVVEVESPFEARQLQVQVAREISTRWADRAASVGPIAQRIAAQFHQRPGNYLAFFSSHDQLAAVAARFELEHPGIPAWRQARRMSEPEQAAFLARFTPGGQGVGFAVLGGSFAEGVDLPGDRLVGAFIASLGLPQVNPVNEQMRQRLQQLCGAGFDYAYLFPGLQKVVQAAGRVIRTPADQGVVQLLDDRFAQPQVRALLPAWWAVPTPAA